MAAAISEGELWGWLEALPAHATVDLRRLHDRWRVRVSIPGVCEEASAEAERPREALASVRAKCEGMSRAGA